MGKGFRVGVGVGVFDNEHYYLKISFEFDLIFAKKVVTLKTFSFNTN